jgi:hypothetical protein
MKKSELKQIIKEEIVRILKEEDFGAFRRLLITSSKIDALKKDIETFMKRPEIKSQYPIKFTIKPGVKPDTIVIDMEGKGATVIVAKLSDLTKKLDKTAVIKTKSTVKRVPVK